MDQQQRARIRERNRRKRRKQVFYARIAAFLIVAALLVGIFFAVRGVMALTGDKNSVTTFQEIENRLFVLAPLKDIFFKGNAFGFIFDQYIDQNRNQRLKLTNFKLTYPRYEGK